MTGLGMTGGGGSADAASSMDRAAAVHDFGNLLQCAMSALRLCEREIRKQQRDDLVQIVGNAMGAVERAARLGHRMAGGAPKILRARVNVGEALTVMRPLLRHALGDAVSLHTVVADGLPVIRCDPADLENVLLNLAINAREAMPNGGHLTVEAAPSRVSTSGIESAPGVTISVQDTGCGMSAAVAAHAFDESFSTKDGSGRGVGLATVQRFADAMGGAAEIVPIDKGGTCVRLLLPAHVSSGNAVGALTQGKIAIRP